MLRFTMLKLNKAEEGGDGGGSTTGYETPPTETPETSAQTSEAQRNTDDFGYEKAPASDQSGKEGQSTKKETKKAEAPSEKKTEQQDAVSGYGTDETSTQDDTVTEDETSENETKDEGLGFEIDTKEMDKSEVEKIVSFAKSHKLSKEAAQAFADMKNEEISAAKQAQLERQKAAQNEVNQLRSKWQKELKTDPNFGGENFVRNVNKVEKLLSEFLPDTKKVLTERKSMLPPYVMRDLSKLADRIFESERLVRGDESGSSGAGKEEKESNPLDFYNS